MAIPYQERYRQGMQSGLHSNIRQALGMMQRQEALAGRPMGPSERAAILQALYGNYADVYGRGMEQVAGREQEEARYEESFELEKKRYEQQQEAAEMQGYAQMAQLGLTGANIYAQSGSGGGGAASGSAGGGAGGGGGEAAGGGGGGGSWWTTSGRYGDATSGKVVGVAAGGAAGYQASPYGQQVEEGVGNPNQYFMKTQTPLGGTHSRRSGQRMSMVTVGAGAGTVAGGFPYGTAGGAFGAYMQENPETGKRGYQEDWEYRIKPIGQRAGRHAEKQFGYQRRLHERATGLAKRAAWDTPTSVAKKVGKKVKDFFGF